MAKQNTLLLDYLKSKKEDKQEAENSASKNRSSLLKDYLSQSRESNKSVNAESLSERLVNPSYRSPLPAAPSPRGETRRNDLAQEKINVDNRIEETQPTLGDRARYVQNVGADTFATFNESLNTLGKGIAQAGKAFVGDLSDSKNFGTASQAAKDAFTGVLDEAADRNYAEKLRESTAQRFSNVSDEAGTKLAADLVSGVNYMLPSIALGGGAAGSALLGATTLPDAYISAKNDGASSEDALKYAGLEALNASVGEYMVGGLLGKGSGLIGKGVNFMTKGKAGQYVGDAMNKLARSPVAKTALKSVTSSLGEGVEEVLQSGISTLNAQMTYDSDAKIDLKETAYEGLLGGLMGGTFQAASLPSTYQAYRSDYDTVNGISKAAEAVTDQSQADMIRQIGESIVKEADGIISDKTADADTIQRAQYIKSGVSATLDSLNQNADSIIKGNQTKYSALEAAVSKDQTDVVGNVARLVRDINDNTVGDKDAVNKTVDFLRGEIQVMNNILATSSDPAQRQEAEINRQNYIALDTAIRKNRKKIYEAMAQIPASEPQTQTETPANETAETVAESTPVQTNVQPDTAAETASEQETEPTQNAPQTTAQTARTAPETESAENGSAVKYTVSDALNIPETDTPEAAAEEVVREYNGSVSDALDAVDKARENYTSENTDAAQESVNRLNEVETAILTKNRAAVQKTANAYAPYLKRFGIDGVVVEDMKAGQNAYYDRNTRTIHLSGRISDTGAVGRFIVHEFTHRGAQIDMSLADSIVAAMDKSGGQAFVSEEAIRNAYGDQLAGMTAEEADAYIREERAAHFMERIMENPDVLEEFRDDRTFLRKLLDAIQDFFTRNNPKGQEKIQLRRIERKINELLKAAEVDAKVKTGGRSETNVVDGDIRLSRDIENDITAEDIETLRTIPRKSVNEFTPEEIQKTEPWARKFYKELGTKSPFFRAWFGDWRSSDPTEIDITEISELPETLDLSSVVERGSFSNADTDWNITVGSLGINDTVSHARGENISPRMLTEIRGIIGNAVLLDSEVSEKSSKKKHIQTAFMHKLYAPVNYNGKSYIAKVSVEEYGAGGNEGRRFYNLKAIKMSPAAGGFDSTGAYSGDTISISDLFSFVKRYDSEFHPKNASKVVNEDGTPKVVYHGTNADFTIFDLSQSGKNYGETSEGFFFFTNKKSAYQDSALDYARESAKKGGEAQVYEVYLDVKKPLRLDSKGYYVTTSYFDENSETIYDEYLSGDYDGVIIENSDKSNDDSVIYLVDNPAQIKSATDNIGTFDTENPDIRYSRDLETLEQRKIRRQQEQIDYLKRQFTSHTAFGWAKAVSPADRKKFAATIAAELPGVSVDEVSAALKSVWDILESPKRGSRDTAEVRWKEARAAAEEAARNLVDSAVQTEVDPMYEQYRDLRGFLRTTPIKLNISKEDMGGDEAYSKWRKGNLGLLRISDDPSARGIDSVYSEVSKQYPEFFPDDITDMSEMLRRLGDVAVELRQFAGNETVKVNPFENVRDVFSADLANRILFGFDSLAQTTLAAREEYGAAVNEADARRIHAEERREAADRERTAYETGLRRGAESNEKLTQTELQRQEMMYQNFISDFRDSERKLQREIERQNKKVESLQNRIAKRSESDRLRVERAKTMSTLSRINTMLTKPNRSKHVPQSLRAPVARLLETLGTTRLPSGKTVNAETMRDIQWKEYVRDAKEDDPFEAESIQLVDSMRTIIVKNQTSEDNAIASAYLEKLRENIERLKMLHAEINAASPDDAVLPPDLATTKHTEYIRQVGKILSMVEHYLKDTDTVFLAGKTVAAKDFSERIISDMKLKKGRNEDKSELRRYFSGLGYEFVSADLFLEMMGDSGTELMKQYRRSQTVQAKCEEEYAEYMLEKTGGDYNTNKAGYNGQTISVSVDGKTLDVPRAQLMQLYLTWKRPAGRRHLRNGGAIFTNKLGQETKEATVQITDEIYRNLMSKLTDEDFRVADAIGWFLSKRCSEWGNDASMKMYGYRMFEDPNYFPLDVSQNAVPDNWDKMEEYYRLENAGMTKALKEDATAPLRMTDVFDVADFHVRTMAAYTAYAPVSNDVQRILSMPGVKEAINMGMGKKGWEYLEKLGKTIASNKVRTGDMSDAARPLQFFMNAYKRQAVSFNISTALKQPLSIVRALNEIDAKYIRQVPFSLSRSEYKRAYNAMIENSGVAKMKMLGYSDTGFGKSLRQIYDRKYTNESGIIRGSLSKSKSGRYTIKAYDKLTDAGMWAAGKADEATWVKLWKACELETKSEYPNLSADERLQKTADRFNEIIGRTQVVDTVLDTAPVMRNNAMAILTPFMNEPTKALATMITAADAVRDGKPHAKKKLAKAVGLVALNNLVLEPIISTLMSVWKDEEDDTENTADFVNKFLKYYIGINPEDGFSFTDFATSNVVGGVFSFPIIQIFYDTISDSLQNYGNEKIDTAALSNLVKSTTNLVTGVWKPKEDRTKTNYTLVRDFIGSAAAVAGIPANTFRRQLSACLRSVLEITDNYELQWEYNKMLYNLENSSALSQKNFYDIMAAAYKAGDTEAYRKMRLELAAIQKESTVGVSASRITKAIEERGGKIEVGSALWNVDLQARFNLGEYVPYMKVESLITGVYKQLDDDSKTKVLYSYPNRSQLEESLNMEEDTLDYAVYEQYVHDSGKRAYQILTAIQAEIGNSAWKKLSAEQKAYAINRAYDFSKSYYKKKLYPDYKLDKWQDEAYTNNYSNKKVADKILEMAKDYNVKQD